MPDSRYRPPPGHSNRTTGPRDGGPITAVTEVKEKRHHGGASGALYEEIAVDRGKRRRRNYSAAECDSDAVTSAAVPILMRLADGFATLGTWMRSTPSR